MQLPFFRIFLTPVIVWLLNSPTTAGELPITGAANPAARPYDELMLRLLKQYGIQGGAVAVSHNGKLVLTRGYGYAEVSTKQAVQPGALFRIASVSKPFTAVAIMKLVEDGRLRLEDHAFERLGLGYGPDARIREITVRHLLTHSAGWDRAVSFDPMFHFGKAAAQDIIREMLKRSLIFAPGRRYSYSNFGYCVLGRVTERVTGLSYEEYVREEVLTPMGIESMQIGSRAGDTPGEVHYYGGGAYSLLPDVMDAHGGWIASAPDLVLFADAVQGRGGRTAFLKPETLAAMIARPEPPLGRGRQWYGLGWSVVSLDGGVNISHTGAMPGTASILVSSRQNYTWAALFNRMPDALPSFLVDLDRGLWAACRAAWQPHP